MTEADADADADLLTGWTWQQLLDRRSFIELDALSRAEALCDEGTARVLAGPFDGLESPWLEPQGITPQSDDGTVIVRGTLDGQAVVVASIEQAFQGGGTGEVSGAKIAQALLLAAADCRTGTPTAGVILFETGGVRLQEANLGLNAVAEICSAALDLRPMAPVIGIVAGTVGSFGGMSIVAGLCTRLIVTPQARIGLNGPAVIEQEAGVEEFDSSDHALIWAVDGGVQRRATGLADALVPDDADALRAALSDALGAGVPPPGEHRSQRIDVLASRLSTIDPAHPPAPPTLRDTWGDSYGLVHDASDPTKPAPTEPVPTKPRKAEPSTAKSSSAGGSSRGHTWIHALAGSATVRAVTGSVLAATTDTALYLTVVPDPDNPFPRARQAQVGLSEALALAQEIHHLRDADDESRCKRAIVAVVDQPSQAYGRVEEMVGLHQAMATTVDAYHAARAAGHPVVAVVVGTALSGGFLTHGLQADQILALDDPGVEIHAMHREAAARITRRSVAELDELAKTIVPMSYRVEDWAALGLGNGLLDVTDADTPSDGDVRDVAAAIDAAVDAARRGPHDLSGRLDSDGALVNRRASRAVRDLLARQWKSSRE